MNIAFRSSSTEAALIIWIAATTVLDARPAMQRVTGVAPVVTTWAEMVEHDADSTRSADVSMTGKVPPFLPDGSGDLPLPPAPSLPAPTAPRERITLPPAPPDEPAPLTPPATKSFIARSDTGWIPPDTDGAAGPNHLLVALNGRVTIQDRDGNQLSDVSLTSFWSSLGVTDTFDPKAIYDPNSGRFLFVTCAERRSAASSMLFAVSATSDPTGTWYKYLLDGDAADVNWVDYPNIGVNNLWITFTANMYSVATDSFAGVNAWAVDKSSALSGGTLTYTLFFRTGEGGTHVPCMTYSTAETTQYLVCRWSDTGWLRIFTITGTASSPVYTATSRYPISSGWSGTFPDAPQKDSSYTIDTNDPRIMNAMLRNGSLWCTHTVALPESAPTRTSVKWWEINPVTGTTIQSGVVDDPTATTFYYFPSIAVNQYDEALVGFSGSSTNTFASAYYTFRDAADAPGTMQAVTLLKAGESRYFKDFNAGRNRWGDYSMTMVDPIDDASFWTIQEYATTPSNKWSTWWGYIPRASSNTLTITSAYGMADPAVGIHTYPKGTSLSAAITNGVWIGSSTRTSELVSTGWVGTGSAPAIGSTTNTGLFNLNEDSTITWYWAVTNLWVSNQTVTVLTTEEALGTITAGDGYTVQPSGDVTFDAGGAVRLKPDFHATSGSTIRARIAIP